MCSRGSRNSPSHKLLLRVLCLNTHRKAASHVRRHTATRTATCITPCIGNESSALPSNTESRPGAAISGHRKCLVEFTRATFRQFSSALVLLCGQYAVVVDHSYRRSADRSLLCSDLRHARLVGASCRARPSVFGIFLGLRAVHRELRCNSLFRDRHG